MILAPLWLLALLTAFFTMVGQKTILEMKKETARDKKREKKLAKKQKALDQLADALNKANERELERVKMEFARAEKSHQVKKETAAKIEAMRVAVEEDPYSTGDDEE